MALHLPTSVEALITELRRRCQKVRHKSDSRTRVRVQEAGLVQSWLAKRPGADLAAAERNGALAWGFPGRKGGKVIGLFGLDDRSEAHV